MEFTSEVVRQTIGASPQIEVRPTQAMLWKLKIHLTNCLQKINHPIHCHEEFVPYLRTTNEQVVVSNNPWQDLSNVREFFTPS